MTLDEPSSILCVAIIAILIVAADQKSTNCNSSCGSEKSATKLNYPFGFSAGCPIQLNCSATGNPSIGEFRVQNVTQNSFFVNLPAQCNRPIKSTEPLFRPNYGPSRQNSFVLENCTDPNSGCSIPTSFLEHRLGLHNCSNISCFSPEGQDRTVMSIDELTQKRCQFLFTTIAVDSNMESIELQTLELVWWLNGICPNGCDENAFCTDVWLADGGKGFRCGCKEGFHGDGFKDGDGCRGGQESIEFNWISVILGYGRGIVFGLSMGHIAFSTGRPKWFVKMVQGNKRANKPKKKAAMNGRRWH